jgi:hypothetical protein
VLNVELFFLVWLWGSSNTFGVQGFPTKLTLLFIRYHVKLPKVWKIPDLLKFQNWKGVLCKKGHYYPKWNLQIIFFGKNPDFGYLLLNWMIPLLNTCHNMKTPNIRVRYLPCFQMGKFVFSFPLIVLFLHFHYTLVCYSKVIDL